MSEQIQNRQKLLNHLVLTKEHPEKIRRSESIISSLGFFGLLALIIGPVLYFRDLGIEKYVLMGCAIAAGMIAMFWQYNAQANRTLEDLHEFIDFDKVKSSLEQDATQ